MSVDAIILQGSVVVEFLPIKMETMIIYSLIYVNAVTALTQFQRDILVFLHMFAHVEDVMCTTHYRRPFPQACIHFLTCHHLLK